MSALCTLSSLNNWFQYGSCQGHAKSPAVSLSLNMRSIIHSVASSARGSIHANIRLGQSFVFQDATLPEKTQITSRIKSMTQSPQYNTKNRNCITLAINPIPPSSLFSAHVSRSHHRNKALLISLFLSPPSLHTLPSITLPPHHPQSVRGPRGPRVHTYNVAIVVPAQWWQAWK